MKLRLAIALAGAAVATAPVHAARPNISGAWGGPHAGIVFQGGFADVQFDCASGTIDVPVYPAKDGAFTARGTYRSGARGPVRVGQIFRSQPANYAGRWTKDAMTLIVTLEDGTTIGPFALSRGAAPQMTRCL